MCLRGMDVHRGVKGREGREGGKKGGMMQRQGRLQWERKWNELLLLQCRWHGIMDSHFLLCCVS